jgi:hypothetical protein
MTKIIRKLRITSDSIVACVTGQCGQLCKKTFIGMLRRKESCMEGKVPSSRNYSFACVHHRESGLEVFSAEFQTLGLS